MMRMRREDEDEDGHDASTGLEDVDEADNGTAAVAVNWADDGNMLIKARSMRTRQENLQAAKWNIRPPQQPRTTNNRQPRIRT